MILSRLPSSLTCVFRLPLLLGMVSLAALCSEAQDLNRIVTRPLTPQEIKTYALPTGTQKSPGLPTVGIGAPVYLEVQVPTATTVSNVVWSLADRPGLSGVSLADSPLGNEIPIYSLGDREVAKSVSRKLLIPDVAGNYQVTADVTTADGVLNLSLYVTAAKYVGVGTINGTKAVWPQCALCHAENAAGWAETNHADTLQPYLDAVPGNHFASYCLDCHTTGYNTAAGAVNDGFDDVATALGWTFPTAAGENFAAMDNKLKQKSSVQCEACHGPGSEHYGRTDMNQASVSTSAGDCAQCHDSAPYHTVVTEWNLSGHSITTRSPSGPGRESCVKCHTGIGFIQSTDGKTIDDTTFEAITCQACHDPHSGENHHQLREVNVVLANGEVVTGGGAGRLCMNCHQSRQNAATYATEYHSRFGPHHGPQGDMVAGKNGFDFGRNIGSSGHIKAVEDSCIGCHMQSLESDDAALHSAGGHTFRMTFDNDTPDDDSDDVDMVGTCQKCHGEIEDFNFATSDYDGDGTVEGVIDEIHGLMTILAMELPPYGEPTVTVSNTMSKAELGAAFNYIFIEEDKSNGAHNTQYAVGLLKASIEAVMIDDFDEDGLPDGFEIANFGDILTTDGSGDADDDGLTDLEEMQQGTNPKLRDTDGDGYDDLSEIIAGFDPLDSDDNLDSFSVRIHPAVEFLVYTEAGKTYQIQSTQDLGNPVWNNIGGPIAGGDDIVQTFFSLIGKSEEFYRVVEVTP